MADWLGALCDFGYRDLYDGNLAVNGHYLWTALFYREQVE